MAPLLCAAASKSLLFPDRTSTAPDRHMHACASAGALAVLVASSMKYVYVLPSPIIAGYFLYTHMSGGHVEPLTYINVGIALLGTPSALNVLVFAGTYAVLVCFQVSTIAPFAGDPRAGVVSALRIAYILHLSETWLGLGLIHIMIEYYRRFVPILTPIVATVSTV